MSLGARLNKLLPVLSAKERAILVLRSLKDKTPEDPIWRQTMPREQSPEFNRLIVLMNACNNHLPLHHHGRATRRPDVDQAELADDHD